MPDEPPVLLAEQIERVPIDTIAPHPSNPNEGDVGAISESVDAVGGFYNVIFVQRSTGRIIAGEHRWRTLKARGSDVAPVVWLDVDDETAARIMIGDNEIARQRSRAQPDLLADLLTVLAEQTPVGLSGTGFDEQMLTELVNNMDVPPLPPTGVLSPDRRELPSGVGFRCGDYTGWISEPVYQAFRTAYEAKREETGEVMLDDVLSVWLGL